MTLRRAFFWIHLAAGLCAGGVILSMSISGMLMSFQPQIVEWAERKIRLVEPPVAGAARLSLDALSAKASDASGKGRLSGVTMASAPGAAVSISFGKEGGSVYLNPYTGEVLGKDSKIQAALRSVEDWHRWLGSREVGRPVTGAACLLFFFLILSGIYLWWPRNWTRAALRSSALPNLRLKGRARDWNWHNAVGFWAAPLLLVTTLTGTLISFRWAGDLLYVLTGSEPPPRPPEGGKRTGGMGPGMGKEAAHRASLDSLWAKAESRIPAWSSISLRFPQKPGGPFIASITEPGFTRRHARSQLTLDAATAGVVKWESYPGQNPGRRLRSWVVPLHTGRAGGPAGQFLALLAAGAATLLAWTGVSMGLRRFFRAGKKPETPIRQPDLSTAGDPMAPAVLFVHNRERFQS